MIMSGITDVAYNAGYTVMICQSNEDAEREAGNIDVLLSNRVAGFLISVSGSTSSGEPFEKIKRRGIPLVFFDRAYTEVDACAVVVDDHDGAFHATEYLIRKGYRKIGHLGGPESLGISRLRLQGYRDALEKHRMPVNPLWIVHGGLNEEDGMESLSRLLLQSTDRTDAIFCVNDPVAMGAILRMREKGIRIPADMAVVGFTDNPMAEMIEPPLTTVRQPAYEIGRSAAELLLDQVRNESQRSPSVHKVLKTELIIRKSA
jgi:LacI family transcriptional regulator